MKIISLDTETTGLKKQDRIIEIGAIEINKNGIGNKFHEYINPGIKIGKTAKKIHKIKNSFIKKKPKFIKISKKFEQFIKNKILLIYNANFDLKMLKKEYDFIDKNLHVKYIDFLDIMRKLFPGKSNTLNSVCIRYGIENKKMHNALSDAEKLAKIFLIYLNKQNIFEFKKKNTIKLDKKFKKKLMKVS
ncbi:3'-5' exonuclease [Candidatus Vidania fulgoroideorum]